MKNTYLINKGYYIKNDIESYLIYFDYFSQGISLPKHLSNRYIRKITNKSLRILILLAYITKLYTKIYPMVELDDEAVIIINGMGKWGSQIKLVRINNELKIVKKVLNKEIYLKEKRFYNLYKRNKSDIKLPKQKFINDNTIIMDFLTLKSFQRLINDGTLSLQESLTHFEKIKEQIKTLYNKKLNLVHGDLWTCNIFIDKDKYYLIDFSDSHTNNSKYDLYVLLYSILSSYHHIKVNDKTIADYSYKEMPITNIIDTNKKDLIKVEKQFINWRESRYPGVYYS